MQVETNGLWPKVSPLERSLKRNKSIQKEQGADIWSAHKIKIKQGERQGAQCFQN